MAARLVAASLVAARLVAARPVAASLVAARPAESPGARPSRREPAGVVNAGLSNCQEIRATLSIYLSIDLSLVAPISSIFEAT